MRWGAFAIASAFVAIAGCGLATSGLLDPASTVPPLDGSPGIATNVLDSSVKPGPADAAGPTNDAGDGGTASSGDDDGGEDASSAAGNDASCMPTSDAGAIATIVGWPGAPPPKIDGDLSDWPCDGRLELTSTNAGYVKNSAQALGALIEARWDKQNLYIAVHVRDSNLDGGAGDDLVDPYNNDSVEVYASGDPTLDGDYDAMTHQYITDWKGLIVDYGPTHGGGLADTKHAHFNAAAMTVAGGWNFEAALGWQALFAGGNSSFASGTSLALDFEVNDGNGVSQNAALVLDLAPAQATCSCSDVSCCCGQTPDLPSCDSARIGRVTLR